MKESRATVVIKSGTTNVEVESIRSRAESTGGGVKLKTCSHRYKTEQYERVFIL